MVMFYCYNTEEWSRWSILMEGTFLKECVEIEILEKLIFREELELATRPTLIRIQRGYYQTEITDWYWYLKAFFFQDFCVYIFYMIG